MTTNQTGTSEKAYRNAARRKAGRIVLAVTFFTMIPALVFYLAIRAGLGLPACAGLSVAVLLATLAGALLLPGRRKKAGAGPPPLPEAKADEFTRTLIEANSELSSFNYTISHEIKAPIRAIDGYARIFLEDYGGGLDDEGRGLIESIRSICRETIALANKLLEYTRFVREQPCNEVVDLRAIVEEVFASLQTAEDADIALRFEAPLPHVIGDRVLLHQAFSNILSNAYKFTRGKAGGLITVGFGQAASEDVFFVRDNGAGFDVQFSQNLFGVFQRMHTADEFEGSGLGLAIVRKIILLHKGRVWITGEVGNGATVFFTLPPDKILKSTNGRA